MFTSLINKKLQLIPPNTYTALRFDEESTDIPNWHIDVDLNSPASALIIPDVEAVARVDALVHWVSAAPLLVPPTQYLARISRDPYGEIDSTATNDRAPTPGAQFHVFGWTMKVFPGQPLAIMVAHNGGGSLAVQLAEFKVWVP